MDQDQHPELAADDGQPDSPVAETATADTTELESGTEVESASSEAVEVVDEPVPETPAESEPEQSADVGPVVEASDPFIGRWNRLVSTTNWEKGRIIHEWRAALIAVTAPITEYSDDMWSRVVNGSVSGQHAGRLRRVYERFGDVHDQYSGLFWSHFQAVLDWDDAEMWLEGAIQNKWSVAKMRQQRWETTGAAKDEEPKDSDVVAAEVDEDFDADANSADNKSDGDSMVADDYVSEATSPEGPDFGDEDDADVSADLSKANRDTSADGENAAASGPVLRPFANLPDLPEDLSAAFESFQLAILNHKTNEWADVSCEDVLASLDALKTLAVAAAE